MKKFLLLAVAISLAMNVNAQKGRKASAVTRKATSSSKIYVGGGLRFESTSDDNLFVLSPELGYKMNPKWGIGVSLGYGTTGSGDSSYSEFIINPYVRQNLLSLGDRVNLILDYQLGYKSAGLKDAKTNTLAIGVAPGLAMDINSRLSAVAHVGFLGYQSQKEDVEGAEAVNKFVLSANSTNISFSLYYNF